MRINNFGNFGFNFQNLSFNKKAQVMSDDNSALDNNTGTIDKLNKWNNNDKSEGISPKWDLNRIPLRFFIDSNCYEEKFLAEFVDTVRLSFLPWSRASYGLIRFQETFQEDSADIKINWSNETVLGRDFETGHNNLKVIGNKIDKAEITIVIYPIIDKSASSTSRIERVKKTSLHEIGHALGLKHSNSPKDLMFYRANNTKLSSNDIYGLNELYNFKNPTLII